MHASESSLWTNVKVKHKINWKIFVSILGFWRKGSLFAHEIGHALGREIHDDKVCRQNKNNEYLITVESLCSRFTETQTIN